MLKNKVTSVLKYLKSLPFGDIFKNIIISPVVKFYSLLKSWGHVLGAVLFILLCLYPLGAFLIHNTSVNTSYESKIIPPGSASIETVSYLINHEVNENFWTPSLPFFFPSYILDNMPNFQLGIMEANAVFCNILSYQNPNSPKLKEAAEFLKYPGTVWMFSPQNKLIPAPSAGSQYRKARKSLIKYNNELSKGSQMLNLKSSALKNILQKINHDLNKTSNDLEKHIREHSNQFIDLKADNVFFHARGKSYAYFLILKSLSQDYKELIVSKNLYPIWIKAVKNLEQATKVNPFIVRNARLEGSFAPNHLAYTELYITKAENSLKDIIFNLETNSEVNFEN